MFDYIGFEAQTRLIIRSLMRGESANEKIHALSEKYDRLGEREGHLTRRVVRDLQVLSGVARFRDQAAQEYQIYFIESIETRLSELSYLCPQSEDHDQELFDQAR